MSTQCQYFCRYGSFELTDVNCFPHDHPLYSCQKQAQQIFLIGIFHPGCLQLRQQPKISVPEVYQTQ